MSDVRKTISEILEWQIVVENAITIIGELVGDLQKDITDSDVEGKIIDASEARRQLVEALERRKKKSEA